jgi:hypothetical protein
MTQRIQTLEVVGGGRDIDVKLVDRQENRQLPALAQGAVAKPEAKLTGQAAENPGCRR